MCVSVALTHPIALSSGRQGIYLWTLDAAQLLPGQEGEAKWKSFNLLEHHNRAVAAAGGPQDWVYPQGCANGTGSCSSITTCYTSMSVVPVANSTGTESSVVIGYDLAAGGWGVPPAGQFDRVFTVQVTIAKPDC